MTQVEIEQLILENGFKLEDKEGHITYEFGTGDIYRISQLLVKKMNYIPCCTELKVDKNYIDFEDWKKRHLIDRNHFNNTYLHDTEGWIEEHRLIDKYNSEVMNL